MAQGAGSTGAQWTRLIRRSKEKVREGLRSLQPWAWTLKRIGGTGDGVWAGDLGQNWTPWPEGRGAGVWTPGSGEEVWGLDPRVGGRRGWTPGSGGEVWDLDPRSGEEAWGLDPRVGGRRAGTGLRAEPAASLLPPAGQFGAGTESYFSLLRFLLLLNVLASVLTACMVLLPTWLEGTPPGPPAPNASSPCGSYNPGSHGLVTFSTELFNLLSGEVCAGSRDPQGTLTLVAPLPEPPCPAFPSAGFSRMVSSLLRVLPAPLTPGHHLPVCRLCHWPPLPAAHPSPVSDSPVPRPPGPWRGGAVGGAPSSIGLSLALLRGPFFSA